MKVIYETRNDIENGKILQFDKKNHSYRFGSPYYLLCYLLGWMTFMSAKAVLLIARNGVMKTMLSEGSEFANIASQTVVYAGALILAFLAAEMVRVCFNVVIEAYREGSFNRRKPYLEQVLKEGRNLIPSCILLETAVSEEKILNAVGDEEGVYVLVDGMTNPLLLPGFDFEPVTEETLFDFDDRCVYFNAEDARKPMPRVEDIVEVDEMKRETHTAAEQSSDDVQPETSSAAEAVETDGKEDARPETSSADLQDAEDDRYREGDGPFESVIEYVDLTCNADELENSGKTFCSSEIESVSEPDSIV